MPRGGKRKGAGRPKESHTLLKLEIRRALVERAHKEMHALFDAQFALAMGVWREKEILDDEGNVVGTRVYQRPPSGEALGYLFDQVIDKAVVHVDLDADIEVENKISADDARAIAQAVKYALPSGTPKTKTGGKDRSSDNP
jgi:hypothetical protein